MLINTDLSADTALASRPNSRPTADAPASQTLPAAANAPGSSQLDPSLQRLADAPAGMQDADWAIQDEQGAGKSLDFLRQSMTNQPGLAMAAQANQLPQNVLSLLQAID